MKMFLFFALCIGFAASFDLEQIQFSNEDIELLKQLIVTAADDGCSCQKSPIPQCGCCFDFKLQGEHSICANISFIKGQKALQFSATMDGEVLFNTSISAVNPPPFCQGLKPLAYICVKLTNMSYGDEEKWGGCLEVYGGVVVQILDIKLGCHYLPVHTDEDTRVTAEKPAMLSEADRFKNSYQSYLKAIQHRYGNKKFQPRHEKKSGISLDQILLKNHLGEGNGIEIPDFN